MERLKRSAVILSLIENLHKEGSWCGETHVQKAAYFLQELLHVPTGFEFILYKHGPYSFDLSDELVAMRGINILQMELRPPYGPSILPGPRSSQLKGLFPKTLESHMARIRFVARELARYGVADLERIATATYVTLNDRLDDSEASQASRIHELKPHISLEAAHRSLSTGLQIRDRATRLTECT
jgi:hypothetical protein